MDMNRVEVQTISRTLDDAKEAVIGELNDLQLLLVGGGCEVSFN